jgi:hypothetical protein
MDDDSPSETATSTPVTTSIHQSNSAISLPSLSQLATLASPPTFASGTGRNYSVSSTSQASCSPYFHSNQTSPAFGPRLSSFSTPAPYSTAFGLGSPALKPIDSAPHAKRASGEAAESPDKQDHAPLSRNASIEQDHDQEATAALLMLNHDRRNWRAGDGGRSSTGMSVHDLLSS